LPWDAVGEMRTEPVHAEVKRLATRVPGYREVSELVDRPVGKECVERGFGWLLDDFCQQPARLSVRRCQANVVAEPEWRQPPLRQPCRVCVVLDRILPAVVVHTLESERFRATFRADVPLSHMMDAIPDVAERPGERRIHVAELASL